MREVRIDTADGEQLGAWYVEGDAGATCFLLLHGNGGSRRGWSALLGALEDRGLSALIPSLRSHGDSSGRLNDFGWSSRHDVIACVRWIRERARPDRLVIAGYSLGAVAAIHAAPELDSIAGVPARVPLLDPRRCHAPPSRPVPATGPGPGGRLRACDCGRH